MASRLDHACGGDCACTTCHIWVKGDIDNLPEMDDDEADRLDMAADLQLISDSLQAIIDSPAKLWWNFTWNRSTWEDVDGFWFPVFPGFETRNLKLETDAEDEHAEENDLG